MSPKYRQQNWSVSGLAFAISEISSQNQLLAFIRDKTQISSSFK